MNRFIKHLSGIIAFLLICPFIYGQKGYFPYNRITQDIDFQFPVFFNPANHLNTKKINDLLQISELYVLQGVKAKNIFKNASTDDGTIYGGKVAISFIVQNNSDKLLSIKFTEASCGATCAYWVRYYNFNSGNGDLIQLKDLFTVSGYRYFSKLVEKRRVSDFKNELQKVDTSERKYYLDIIECYKDTEIKDYYVNNGILYVDGENWFSKNQKFAGIKTLSHFKLSEFIQYLNNYGRCLFSVTQDSIQDYHSHFLPQLFYGTIARQNVVFVLNSKNENEMRAEYVYLKYKKGIYLEGQFDNTELILNEKNFNSKDTAIIKAKFDGQHITGTWTNKGNTHNYPVHLMRK